ncbi:PREDICTED: protein FAR1-RELATED SEQUENCE 11-like [Lupinus angustifolius]|uniref:protein FAR1-RELATED SEQUENCE 11-like n=1 Tax=Lupinus angustifolius TaxID=3871 RepID=UPI00092F3019|nr:PREDICTED: protein FAR1-RELATED SEQUENCE 11-like [Lupinus angustifolius]
MPLGLWVEVDNHGNSIFFDCVVLRNEKIPSFTWALKVGVAVNIRNQAGEEAIMRQKYHNPHIITSFSIEEHVATILTPYAFQLLQHEIELSSKYAATKIDNDSYVVRHHTKLDGGHLLRLIYEQESINCSCKEFDFSGILCRHAIRVSLVQCLEVETLKTKDRVEVATKELERVIDLVKGMSDEVIEPKTDLEHGVRNEDECDIQNPITSKTKGRPKGSRPKGGVEIAKTPVVVIFLIMVELIMTREIV